MQNNQAFSGGAIYLNDCIDSQNTFNNINLQGNSALSSGGGIFSKNSDFQFLGIIIIQDNNALMGGGIRFIDKAISYYTQLQNNQTRRNLNTDILIENNQATIFGNNIGFYPTGLQITNLSYGQFQLKQQSQNFYDILDYRSGKNLQFLVQIIDDQQEPIILDQKTIQTYQSNILDDIINSFVVYIDHVTNDCLVEGDTIINIYDFDLELKGFVMDNLQIYRNNIDQISLNLNSNIIKTISRIDNQIMNSGITSSILNIQFQECITGEIKIYHKLNYFSCLECPEGTYSTTDPSIATKCIPCPENSANCYKDQILLKNGFWAKGYIKDENDIFYCNKQSSNCVSEDSNSIDHCLEGHLGPLCEVCDIENKVWGDYYVRTPLYLNCVKCNEQHYFNNIIKSLFLLFAEVWFIQFSLKNIIKNGTNLTYGKYLRLLELIPAGTCAYQDKSPFYIKQFFHYMALVKICNPQNYFASSEIYSNIKIIPSIFSSPIQLQYFLLDCWFTDQNDNIDIVFKRGIWCLCIPFIYATLLSMLYMLYLVAKKRKFNKYHIINGSIFFLIYMQPGILSEQLKIINCRIIGGIYYNASDVSFGCATQQQINYTNYLGSPIIVIFAVIIPMLILRKIYHTFRLKRNTWYTYRIKTGFISSDTKPQYYYWEFVRMYVKIIIIVFNSCFDSQSDNKLIFASLMIFLYYALSTSQKPYKFKEILKIDQLTSQILMFLAAFNLIIYYRNENENMILFLQILCTLIDLNYFVYLIFKIVDNKLKAVIPKKYANFQQKIVNKIPFASKIITVQKFQSFKCYKHWVLCRKALLGFIREQFENYKLIIEQEDNLIENQSEHQFLALNNNQNTYLTQGLDSGRSLQMINYLQKGSQFLENKSKADKYDEYNIVVDNTNTITNTHGNNLLNDQISEFQDHNISIEVPISTRSRNISNVSQRRRKHVSKFQQNLNLISSHQQSPQQQDCTPILEQKESGLIELNQDQKKSIKMEPMDFTNFVKNNFKRIDSKRLTGQELVRYSSHTYAKKRPRRRHNKSQFQVDQQTNDEKTITRQKSKSHVVTQKQEYNID